MKEENSTRSTLRVVSVLSCFSPDRPELNAAEISQTTGIPMTTTYRILAGLTKGRLLDRNKSSGKYGIGAELYMLGSLYLSTTNITKVVEPAIKTLNDLTNEAVNVGVLDKGSLVIIMKEESRSAFRISVHIGSNMPAYSSAMGKALLSELSEEEIDKLYPDEKLRPLTSKTLSTKTELKLELEEIRETGISFAREESIEKVIGIASVIRGADGKAPAAISISVPVFRMNQETSDRLSTLVKMGASLISYRLGYQDKNNPIRDIEEIRSWWMTTK